jgi:hypothetical protein
MLTDAIHSGLSGARDMTQAPHGTDHGRPASGHLVAPARATVTVTDSRRANPDS